jgi:hypothetical protein
METLVNVQSGDAYIWAEMQLQGLSLIRRGQNMLWHRITCCIHVYVSNTWSQLDDAAHACPNMPNASMPFSSKCTWSSISFHWMQNSRLYGCIISFPSIHLIPVSVTKEWQNWMRQSLHNRGPPILALVRRRKYFAVNVRCKFRHYLEIDRKSLYINRIAFIILHLQCILPTWLLSIIFRHTMESHSRMRSGVYKMTILLRSRSIIRTCTFCWCHLS